MAREIYLLEQTVLILIFEMKPAAIHEKVVSGLIS